ncbi:hypothetical protein LTR17_020160 [Elasticomyces elasticus]|nr:hypothetical protein LTR17_020160 [Elasticomyces elasticus]
MGLQDGPDLRLRLMNALGIHTAHHMSVSGFDESMNFDCRDIPSSIGNHGGRHDLSKLDMSSINRFDMSSSLWTSPALNSYAGFDPDQVFSYGNTVNPAQLHSGRPTSATSQSPNYEAFMYQHPLILEGDEST